eukprot:scaffold150011_cov30-Tisochrysis_lutea.AAC.7
MAALAFTRDRAKKKLRAWRKVGRSAAVHATRAAVAQDRRRGTSELRIGANRQHQNGSRTRSAYDPRRGTLRLPSRRTGSC